MRIAIDAIPLVAAKTGVGHYTDALAEGLARAHPELRVILPDDVRLTRAFYLVRHQDDARVARINRMAEVVVDWMRTALAEPA